MLNRTELLPYQHFSNFILRTPALPFNGILELLKIEDDQKFLDKLRVNFTPYVNEAIYLASGSLHIELSNFFAGVTDKIKDPATISYLKYLIRMSTRSTPFGLFSGCSVGHIETSQTKISLPAPANYKIKSRVDTDYLSSILRVIQNNKLLKENVPYRLNNSIYKVGDEYRYIEFNFIENRRKYMLASVESTPYLDAVMTLKNQSFIRGSLGQLLLNFTTNEHVEEFIESLIESKVIISTIEPNVTGEELVSQTIKKLRMVNFPYKEDSLKYLETIVQLTSELDTLGPGKSLRSYNSLKEHIETMDVPPSKDLYQVDLLTEASECKLDTNVVKDILEGISVLNKCSNYEADTFSKFKQDFIAKYEDEEIPLLEAIDAEMGVQFGSFNDANENRIIKGLQYGSHESAQTLSLTSFDQLLLHKYIDYKSNSATEIVIEESDFETLESKVSLLPNTIFAVCEIIKDHQAQTFIHLSHVGGNSAANIIARFCHSSTDIHNLAKKIIEKENSSEPNVIVAEIVHIPQSRIGNIVLRPHLRSYEIPIITESCLDQNFVISLDDLFISVRNGHEIVLRSKRLNKIIKPLLTNAHNYTLNTVPVYRFLSALQSYNTKQAFAFTWSKFFGAMNHLPRVRFKNIILSLARWVVTWEEFANTKNQDENYISERVSLLFSDRKIPYKLWIIDGDNKIYIDISNKWCRKIFVQELKRKRKIELNEFLHNCHNPVVIDSEGGSFPHEILTFFHKNYQR